MAFPNKNDDKKVEDGKKDPKDPKDTAVSGKDGGDDKELDKTKIAEDIKALFSGTELSEELQTSIATICVAAIHEKVEAEKEKAKADAKADADAKMEETIAALSEDVDKYLTRAVKVFLEENEVAISSGVQVAAATKIVESAKEIAGTYGLEIDEATGDALVESETAIAEATAKLDESLAREVSLESEISALKKDRAMVSLKEGLAMTDAERLETLAESVEFEDEAQFTTAVQTLKESFLKAPKAVVKPKLDEGKVVNVPKDHTDLNEGVVETQKPRRRF